MALVRNGVHRACPKSRPTGGFCKDKSHNCAIEAHLEEVDSPLKYALRCTGTAVARQTAEFLSTKQERRLRSMAVGRAYGLEGACGLRSRDMKPSAVPVCQKGSACAGCQTPILPVLNTLLTAGNDTLIAPGVSHDALRLVYIRVDLPRHSEQRR